MVRAWVYHQTGPNSDLCSENGRILHVKHFRNIEMPTNMATGDVKTHSDRPRCLWGIGSRLGYPSKYQSRPRTYRNHITAPQTTFHTQIHGHVGEIPPSFDGIAQKQNTHGQGEGRDGFGMGGGYFCSVFAHVRPTLAVLWTFPRTFQEDEIFAKCGDEVSMG
jgi:hypothetical protein